MQYSVLRAWATNAAVLSKSREVYPAEGILAQFGKNLLLSGKSAERFLGLFSLRDIAADPDNADDLPW